MLLQLLRLPFNLSDLLHLEQEQAPKVNIYAVGDSKSRSSLFFHLPVNNPRRTNSNLMGNTYQPYLWVTPRK